MGRAYGSKNNELLQNYFNKGLSLIIIILIMFSVFTFFTEPILVSMG